MPLIFFVISLVNISTMKELIRLGTINHDQSNSYASLNSHRRRPAMSEVQLKVTKDFLATNSKERELKTVQPLSISIRIRICLLIVA